MSNIGKKKKKWKIPIISKFLKENPLRRNEFPSHISCKATGSDEYVHGKFNLEVIELEFCFSGQKKIKLSCDLFVQLKLYEFWIMYLNCFINLVEEINYLT